MYKLVNYHVIGVVGNNEIEESVSFSGFNDAFNLFLFSFFGY